MDRQLGSILAHQASAVAEKLFGAGYARAMMAQSLQDLALLLLNEAVYTHPSQKKVSMRSLLYVTFAVNYVVQVQAVMVYASLDNTAELCHESQSESGGAKDCSQTATASRCGVADQV